MRLPENLGTCCEKSEKSILGIINKTGASFLYIYTDSVGKGQNVPYSVGKGRDIPYSIGNRQDVHTVLLRVSAGEGQNLYFYKCQL